jgi:hypothetical protein
MQVLSARQVAAVEYFPVHVVTQVPSGLSLQPPPTSELLAQALGLSCLHGSMQLVVPDVSSTSSHVLSEAQPLGFPAYLTEHFILQLPSCQKQTPPLPPATQPFAVEALAQVSTQTALIASHWQLSSRLQDCC